MTLETLGLLAGLVLLLSAVIGGGFRMGRAEIRPTPQWVRLLLAVLGIAFVAPSIYDSFLQRMPRSGRPPNEVTIYSDYQAETTNDNIRLLSVQVMSRRNPPHVNDRLTVEFVLRNTAGRSVTLGSTFLGVRDPKRSHKDSPEQNVGQTLAVDEELRAETTVVVDQGGKWELWPCYAIGDKYCPDEWHAFEIVVAE